MNRIEQTLDAIGGAVIDGFNKLFPEKYEWISIDLPAVDLREDPDLAKYNDGDDILLDQKVWRCFPLAHQKDRMNYGNNWWICVITGANCYGQIFWDWNYNVEFTEEEVWEAIGQNRELSEHMEAAHQSGKRRNGEVMRHLRATRQGGGGSF